MGKKRTPATKRSTYIIADKPGGTKMRSGSRNDASVREGMRRVTLPGEKRISTTHAVQGSTLMQWDTFEGGNWIPVRTIGPKDIYKKPEKPPPGPPKDPPKGPVKDDEVEDNNDPNPGTNTRLDYANPKEKQLMDEAEIVRLKRKKLLDDIEERRKLRLKHPRRFGRFSLMSGTEVSVPSLLGG